MLFADSNPAVGAAWLEGAAASMTIAAASAKAVLSMQISLMLLLFRTDSRALAETTEY